LETVAEKRQIMTTSHNAEIRKRVRAIETMPAIPSVFMPLLDLLGLPEEKVKLDEVVRLVSYDNTIAAQCLRMAASPLFGLPNAPKSIKGAVIGLGLRRVETILLTCCLGQAFPARKLVVDPTVFWKHSLGCAMVCRKFSEMLGAEDHEKAYMAGLLHDIGFMVNCVAFSEEFSRTMAHASQNEMPLIEAETTIMGFTHCQTGQALAQQWKLTDDIVDVIAHHHAIEHSSQSQSLVALVHLSDLLCRMRSLGYGYYERHRADLACGSAWDVLLRQYHGLSEVDLAHFTFELDEGVNEIQLLVDSIFGSAAATRV
jgi:putative nucleotidyltransferase with HDIG domain